MVGELRRNRRSNKPTFLITEAQQGKAITVKVTPKNAKGTGKTVESNPTKAVDTLPTAKNVTISGQLEIGKTLTVRYTYEDVNGDEESGTINPMVCRRRSNQWRQPTKHTPLPKQNKEK